MIELAGRTRRDDGRSSCGGATERKIDRLSAFITESFRFPAAQADAGRTHPDRAGALRHHPLRPATGRRLAKQRLSGGREADLSPSRCSGAWPGASARAAAGGHRHAPWLASTPPHRQKLGGALLPQCQPSGAHLLHPTRRWIVTITQGAAPGYLHGLITCVMTSRRG